MVDPATLKNIVGVLVNDTVPEELPTSIIDGNSDAKDFPNTHPRKLTNVAPVRFTSPAVTPSTLYSSVMTDPAFITDQP